MHRLRRVDHEAKTREGRAGGVKVTRSLLPTGTDEKEIVEVTRVKNAQAGKEETDGSQKLRADARGRGEAKGHGSEAPVALVERESEERHGVFVQRERKKTIGEIYFCEPATLPCEAHGRVDRLVVKGNMFDEVVHVARQVNADPRLFVWFDDDVQRLHMSGPLRRVGESLDRADAKVILEARGDLGGVVEDGERIVEVLGWRRGRIEGNVHAMLNGRADEGEIGRRRAACRFHVSDGGKPKGKVGGSTHARPGQRRREGNNFGN